MGYFSVIFDTFDMTETQTIHWIWMYETPDTPPYFYLCTCVLTWFLTCVYPSLYSSMYLGSPRNAKPRRPFRPSLFTCLLRRLSEIAVFFSSNSFYVFPSSVCTTPSMYNCAHFAIHHCTAELLHLCICTCTPLHLRTFMIFCLSIISALYLSTPSVSLHFCSFLVLVTYDACVTVSVYCLCSLRINVYCWMLCVCLFVDTFFLIVCVSV